MRIEQRFWNKIKGWQPADKIAQRPISANLLLIFGSTEILKHPDWIGDLKKSYPEAMLVGCSTAGEICDTSVFDDSLVLTAIEFEHTKIQGELAKIDSAADSYRVGKKLAQALSPDGLVHVFVLSDGLQVNGSELVQGLAAHLPDQVTVTGGLSGDGERFKETLVLFNEAPRSHQVVALGFYGERLRIGYGSLGGWDPFGPERLITRSKGNVLYELDGKSALELYKLYLGEHADGLPATGLLFPLALRTKEGKQPVVRTILGIDEATQSMIFAGDMPEGAFARLMKANFDRLIDGAAGAAKTSYEAIGSLSPDLAILISCVGRKLVLRQRIEEEVESVRETLGARPVLAGFYSYGEISPFTPSAKCELHNQTMTITTFSEI